MFVVNFKFKNKKFQVLTFDTDYHPSFSGFIDEQNIREQLWNIGPGDYVLDVGACYGSYTLTALIAGAEKVYAWSPQSHDLNFSDKIILELSLALNGWENKCIVYENGLYDKNGWLDCYAQKFYEHEPLSYIKNPATNTISDLIKVSTLDQWYEIEKSNIQNKNIWMKIDVEGAELEVLMGAYNLLKELNISIIIENHLINSPDINIKKFLHDLLYEEITTVSYFNRSFSVFRKKLKGD
jgi:FkbM family methyltransferase